MHTIEQLAEMHAGEIHGYLCRMLGDYATARDILSDVFLKAVECARKSKAMEISKPWLYRVATNCAISHIRRQKVRNLFRMNAAREDAPHAKTPYDMLREDEDIRNVRRAIATLGEKLKTVLIMRIYQDLSYEEIAEALKINVGTVKSRLNEAKNKIAQFLEDIE